MKKYQIMKYFKYSIAFLIIFSSSQNSFQLRKFLNLLQSQDSLTMFLWTLFPSVPPPFHSLIPKMCFSSRHFCNIFLTVTRHHLCWIQQILFQSHLTSLRTDAHAHLLGTFCSLGFIFFVFPHSSLSSIFCQSPPLSVAP